jgi:hypothetical protein
MRVLLGLVVAALLAPLAVSTPLACGSPCEILALSAGYVAPATEVSSGSSVAWRSLDVGHLQEDTSTGAHCFREPSTLSGEQEQVRFDIVDGTLVATTDGRSATCGLAVALPDGSQVLAYQCAIHAVMRGVLVVSP